MKQRLKDLWREGTRLCLVQGSTGELAKVGIINNFYIQDQLNFPLAMYVCYLCIV